VRLGRRIKTSVLQHTPGLTEQELALASAARYDLGSGYPQIEAPEFVRRLFRDDRLEDLGLMGPPAWNAEKQALVDADLIDAVQRTLGPDSFGCAVKPTFSGSVAVDRAIVACLRRSRGLGYQQLEVVTTSPSIDIMRDFLGERSDIVTLFSDCQNGMGFPLLDLDRVASLIAAPLKPGTTRAVLLTSPENPSGQFWSLVELKSIAGLCQDRGFSLVVDHCFLLAGVHDSTPPAVWQLGDTVEFWIGIWDTGKTYGLNGEKIGFLLCSPSMAVHADDAIRVLQFETSRRQRLFFTELLRAAPYFDYISDLRTACRMNLDGLVALATERGLACLKPPAGSLALLDISSLNVVDTDFQRVLLEAGVGLVTGSSFFHGSTKCDTLMRVALARDPRIFSQALDVMNELLSKDRFRSRTRP